MYFYLLIPLDVHVITPPFWEKKKLMLCSSGQIIQLELLKNSDRKGALFQQNIGLGFRANCFFQSLNQAASIHSFIMAEKVCVCEL